MDFDLIVTDLKQYAYCPRVLFYERCLPHVRPRTYKMDAGRDEHERERKRAARRNLSKYGITDGQRRFDARLHSASLGLVGEVDEIVYSSDGEIFPVDYKQAKRASTNYKLQLAAYALLIEAAESTSVRRGFLYLIPKRQTVEVPITGRLRTTVLELIAAMHHMIAHETMPAPASTRSRCTACEFRRFCNDV